MSCAPLSDTNPERSKVRLRLTYLGLAGVVTEPRNSQRLNSISRSSTRVLPPIPNSNLGTSQSQGRRTSWKGRIGNGEVGKGRGLGVCGVSEREKVMDSEQLITHYGEVKSRKRIDSRTTLER